METINNKAPQKGIENHNGHDTNKDIENHKKIAKHLQIAAKHHLDAAAHHEKGNHELAAKSTLIASGHANIAHETQKEDLKDHALHSSL